MNQTSDQMKINDLTALHNNILENTESLEPLCPALPYLYAAVASGGVVELWDGDEGRDDEARLLDLLRQLCPDIDHWVWDHVLSTEEQ